MGEEQTDNKYGRQENSDTKVEASIILELSDVRKANTLYAALLPEKLNPPTYRSKIDIELNGSSLKINISSNDLISLRASINSYLKWIATIIGALEVMENEL